jgi:hypothetical protein
MTVLASLTQLSRHVGVIIAHCREAIGSVLRPYRPELYYMRGPGPKCQARHRASRSKSN